MSKTLDVRPFLPALKIHDSSYDYVEGSPLSANWGLSATDMNVYFRPETFSHNKMLENVLNEDNPAIKHFKIALEALSQYRNTNFEEFFWSARSTATYFNGVDDPMASDPSFLVDNIRHQKWNMLATYFNKLVPERAQSYAEDFNDDPCHYEALVQHAQFTEDSIHLPLHSFVEVEKDNRDACLANVIAMFANHAAVHFISVHPRYLSTYPLPVPPVPHG